MTLAEGDRRPNIPLWQTLSRDISLVSKEKTIAQIIGQEGMLASMSNALQRYYWNTGIPYFTFEGTGYSDAMRLSFAWDRPSDDPKDKPSLWKRRKPTYLNDEQLPFDTVTPVGKDQLGIGSHEDQQYLVVNGKHIISPPFDEITPTDVDGHRFKVRIGKSTKDARVLTDDERAKIIDKRKEYDALHAQLYNADPPVYRQKDALQRELALQVLSHYGLREEDIEIDGSTFYFTYKNTYIRLSPTGNQLSIMTWDANLSHAQRHTIWHKYDTETQSKAVQIAILDKYLDSAGEPHFLDQVADKIYANMDGISAEKRQFFIEFYNLQKKNNFRDFNLVTPHPTWGIPIAMELATEPLDDVYQIISPFGTIGHGHLEVPEPGMFQPSSYNEPVKQTWTLNEQGNIATKKNNKL